MLSIHKNIPYSDRKHNNVSALHDEDERPYYNQLLSERKHDFEGDSSNLPEEYLYFYSGTSIDMNREITLPIGTK